MHSSHAGTVDMRILNTVLAEMMTRGDSRLERGKTIWDVARYGKAFNVSAEWDYDNDLSERLCEACAEDDVNSRWIDGTFKAADGDLKSKYS